MVVGEHGIQTFEPIIVMLLFCVIVIWCFYPTSAHSLSCLDKWFVQIYLNVILGLKTWDVNWPLFSPIFMFSYFCQFEANCLFLIKTHGESIGYWNFNMVGIVFIDLFSWVVKTRFYISRLGLASDDSQLSR
jgi:hypothetical protein